MLERITDGEVKAAIEDLPEQFRLPVYLADVEGFAYKEIAEMLDIPIGTVMSRLHRGRKGLEKRLHDFVVDRAPHHPRRHRDGRPRIATTSSTSSTTSSTASSPPTGADALQEHLEDCPPCFETADFQAQLRPLIAKRCCEEVPDGLRRGSQCCSPSVRFTDARPDLLGSDPCRWP